jgi:hypothetical protein
VPDLQTDENEVDSMSDDRPIKMHCDEEMRSQIEFCVRRYRWEVERWIERKRTAGQPIGDLQRELELTDKCLKEAQEAGT